MPRSRRPRAPRQRDVVPVVLPADPALIAEADPDAIPPDGPELNGPELNGHLAGPHGTDAPDPAGEAVAALAEPGATDPAGPPAAVAEHEAVTKSARKSRAKRTAAPKPVMAEPVAADPEATGPADAVTHDHITAEPVMAEPAVAEQHLEETRAHDVWDTRVAGTLAFLRRRLTGSYDVDEFGFDRELADGVVHPLLHPLYRDWFRVEVSGAKHVPLDGAALVVANHSGTVALDALMLAHSVQTEPQIHRHLRLLGADLVFRLPFLSEVARKSGATLACQPDAERLLRRGELVGVFPEGFKGVGKNYRDRYKLQRFGRGGFVAAALATGTPIVPVAIVGAEETYPMLGNVRPLARLLGLPYFPVTPTFPWLGPLGLVPLPSKWLIEFCAPIETEHLTEQADDPMVVFNLADQVRETIQQTLHELLARRPEPF